MREAGTEVVKIGFSQFKFTVKKSAVPLLSAIQFFRRGRNVLKVLKLLNFGTSTRSSTRATFQF